LLVALGTGGAALRGTLGLGKDRAQALHLGIALLQLAVKQCALRNRLALLGQQAFVVAVQAGQLFLTGDATLLQGLQLALQLPHLGVDTPLLVFKRANLRVLVGQAQLQLTERLIKAGAAQQFRLQAGLGGRQFVRLGLQRAGLNLVLLMGSGQCALAQLQLQL
jgi:hypothetical protein